MMINFSAISIVIITIVVFSLSFTSLSNNNNFFVSANVTAIRQLLLDREAVAKRLVKVAEDALLKKCDLVANWNGETPETCEIAACGTHYPDHRGFGCSNQFGADPKTCDVDEHETCGGLVRSWQSPSVIFPPNTSNYDQSSIEFMVWSRAVDEAAWKEYETGAVKAWINFAQAKGGLHRLYPGVPFGRSEKGVQPETCAPYDNRQRQWTANAAAGPRDVVVVMDTSGSLFETDCRGCKSRLELMQESAISILNALSFNDFFAVVTFNSVNSGEIITNDGKAMLLQATYANKSIANDAIRSVRTTGYTNFETGFRKAFQILRESSGTTSSSGCAKTILFLTDGTPNDGVTIDGFIESQQQTLSERARIFTFTVSNGASLEKPRSIACNNGGLHQHFGPGEHPSDSMRFYLEFLAVGNPNATTPVSGEVYVDAFGLGSMTTTSLPFYNRLGGQEKYAGVIGIDVTIDEFLEISTLEELNQELFRRSAECPTKKISDCEMQKLRNKSGFECPNLPSYQQCLDVGNVTADFQCPTAIKPEEKNPVHRAGGMNALLCQPINYETNLPLYGYDPIYDVLCCDCSLRPHVVTAIVASVVSVVAVVGILAGVYLKMQTNVCSSQNNNNSNNNIQENNNNNNGKNKKSNDNNDDDEKFHSGAETASPQLMTVRSTATNFFDSSLNSGSLMMSQSTSSVKYNEESGILPKPA